MMIALHTPAPEFALAKSVKDSNIPLPTGVSDLRNCMRRFELDNKVEKMAECRYQFIEIDIAAAKSKPSAEVKFLSRVT
jgi:hypothetical protein